MQRDPRFVAMEAITEMIEEGAKTHAGESWRDEDVRMHTLKAIRHLTTFLLILDGHYPPDGENHLRNALCRTAMSLTNYLYEPKKWPREPDDTPKDDMKTPQLPQPNMDGKTDPHP